MFESPDPLAGETDSVWVPFDVRFADAKIVLFLSAGFSVRGEQEPFDADTERQQPFWGDPSWRAIPRDVAADQLEVTHLHINPADLVQDPEFAFPARTLDALVADGIVGASTSTHLPVMGYQQAGLEEWRSTTGPEIVAKLRERRGRRRRPRAGLTGLL